MLILGDFVGMSRRTSAPPNKGKKNDNSMAPAQTMRNLNERNKQDQVKDNSEKDGQRSQFFSQIIEKSTEKGGQVLQQKSQTKPTGNSFFATTKYSVDNMKYN
jgi:hypothetical protein